MKVVNYAVFSPTVGLIDGITLPTGSTPEDAVNASRSLALMTLGEVVTKRLYEKAYALKIQETER